MSLYCEGLACLLAREEDVEVVGIGLSRHEIVARVTELDPDVVLLDPTLPEGMWVAGPYTAIGMTTKTTFVDRNATPRARYNYEIVAVGDSGGMSQPSNVAAVPSQASAATFADLHTAMARLSDGASAKNESAMRELTRLASDAQVSWRRTGPSASLPVLKRLATDLAANRTRSVLAANPGAASDVQNAIFRLQRLASIDRVCPNG